MNYEYRKPDNRDREEQTVSDMLMGFILGLIVCLLITLCSSCTTTQYVTVPEYHTDTLMVNHTAYDSIYVHDSVSVWQNGDTVKIHEWHTKYKLKEVHDTTYISKTDSIPYPIEVPVEVPAQLTWWQQARLHLANILLWLLLILGVGWVLKKKFLP